MLSASKTREARSAQGYLLTMQFLTSPRKGAKKAKITPSCRGRASCRPSGNVRPFFFAFFAALREIWVCALRASRVFEALSPARHRGHNPRAALRLPGVREWPPLRGYCG